MKINKVVFLILFFGSIDLYSQYNFYESLVENIMTIWTKIDIVRAINTDNSQKNIFLEDLINDSFDAYYLSRHVKKLPFTGEEYDKDMVNLIISVQESFEEVFCPVKNVDFHVFCFVLQKIVHVLKTPENIESKIAT